MTFKNEISQPYEIDVYNVHLTPNVEYVAVAVGLSGGQGTAEGLSLPDPFVFVMDLTGNGSVVAVDDDTAGDQNAGTVFTVPAERDYYLAVGDITGGTGVYETAVVATPSGIEAPGGLFAEFIYDPATGTVEEKNTQTASGQFEVPPLLASGTMGVQGEGYTPINDFLFA
jgi:hypothetical protein